MARSLKRQRKKDGRRARIEAQQRLANRQRLRNRVITVTVVTVGLVLALFAITTFGDDDEVATDTSTTSTTASEDAGFTYGTGECPPDTKPTEPQRSFTAAPQKCIDPDATDYGAVVRTSEGDFTIDLAEDTAPGTVNNFVVLARYGYYDGLSVHRAATDFVLQTGDPNGDGSGGPGYSIADELPESVEAYVEGSIAMANSGPDTGGSQWFAYTGPNSLGTPDYALFGQITSGLDVVKTIVGLAPESGDGVPTREVTVTGIDITETAKTTTTTTTSTTTDTSTTTTAP